MNNEMLTKMIGIVIAVIVSAVVLVPICNSIAEDDGGGGSSSGGSGTITIENFVGDPFTVISADSGNIPATNMTDTTASFQTVNTFDLSDNPVQVKNGMFSVETASGTLGFSSVDTVWGFQPYGSAQTWGGTYYLADHPNINSWEVTDWSISSSGVLTASLVGNDPWGGSGDVSVTLTEDVLRIYTLGSGGSGDLYQYGAFGQYVKSPVYGFNKGSRIAITTGFGFAPMDEEATVERAYLPTSWIGTVPDSGKIQIDVQCVDYNPDTDETTIGGTETKEIDLTVFDKGDFYLYDGMYWAEHEEEVQNGLILPYDVTAGPKTYTASGAYVPFNIVEAYLASDGEIYWVEINNDDFEYMSDYGVLYDGEDEIYLSSVIAKIGSDKYVLDTDGQTVINAGPSTASDFEIITQEGYGILTTSGVYVEITDEDEIGLLHIQSYSSEFVRANPSVSSNMLTVSTGGELMTLTAGKFGQFSTNANGSHLIQSGGDPADPFHSVFLSIPTVSAYIEYLVSEDNDLAYSCADGVWSVTNCDVGNPEGSGYVDSRQIADYVEWGSNTLVFALPMTLDMRYVDFNAESSDDGEGGGDSGRGIVGTIVMIIPIFVILSILMGAMMMFRQGENDGMGLN